MTKKDAKLKSTIRAFNSLVYDLEDAAREIEEFMETPEYKSLLKSLNARKLSPELEGEIETHLIVKNITLLLKQLHAEWD